MIADAVWPGRPYPRGASWDGLGVNFALFSENAERVELCLFDPSGRHEVQCLVLPEPCARNIGGELRWHDALFGYRIGHHDGDLSFDRCHRRTVAGAAAPSRNDEYLLYQRLIGSLPSGELDVAVLAGYANRVTRATLKAAVFARYGALNSIALAMVKTLSPAVPAFYQGCELIDLSMVDPDNRRPVDFELRRTLLGEMRELAEQPERGAALCALLAQAADGRAKFWATWRALQWRRSNQSMLQNSDHPPIGAIWGDTRVHWPSGETAPYRGVVDAISGSRHTLGEHAAMPLARVLADFPVAALSGEPSDGA